MLMLVAFITEGGRLFQAVVTLSENTCFRIFFWALWVIILVYALCFLFSLLFHCIWLILGKLRSHYYIVCRILYTSIISPLSLLKARVGRFRVLKMK